MAYSMSDLKKGLKIELEGIPYRITEYQHVKPGREPALLGVKIKRFQEGGVWEKTFMPAVNSKEQNWKEKQMQFL